MKRTMLGLADGCTQINYVDPIRYSYYNNLNISVEGCEKVNLIFFIFY